jgi:hypothetical protein
MIRVPAAAEKNTRPVAAVWPEGSCLGVRATWRRLSDRAERGNRLQISKVLISGRGQSLVALISAAPRAAPEILKQNSCRSAFLHLYKFCNTGDPGLRAVVGLESIGCWRTNKVLTVAFSFGVWS